MQPTGHWHQTARILHQHPRAPQQQQQQPMLGRKPGQNKPHSTQTLTHSHPEPCHRPAPAAQTPQGLWGSWSRRSALLQYCQTEGEGQRLWGWDSQHCGQRKADKERSGKRLNWHTQDTHLINSLFIIMHNYTHSEGKKQCWVVADVIWITKKSITF